MDKPKAALALRRWLDRERMTIEAFAGLVGTRRGTVTTWLYGARRPIAKTAEKIERLTAGLVRRTEWGTGKQRSWTTADDEDLARLHAAGLNDRKISAILGRTTSSVRTRRCHFGIVRKHWRSGAITDAPSNALIAELRSRGYAVSEAEQHGGVVSF